MATATISLNVGRSSQQFAFTVDESLGLSDNALSSVSSPSAPNLLTWAPPVGWESYEVKTIPAAGGTITMDNAKDYRIVAPDIITGPVTLTGGRNRVWIGGKLGGRTTVPVVSGPPPQGGYDSENRGIRISDGADVGIDFIEGIWGLPGTYFSDFLQCAIRTNNGRTLIVQNMRKDGWTWGTQDTNHADAFQCWGGPRTMKVDRFTAYNCTYQGFYWDPSDGRTFPTGAGSPWEVKHVNLVGSNATDGAKYLLANRDAANTQIVNTEVFTKGQGYSATDSFGAWPSAGLTQSADPPGGDFVPASLWSTGSYVSPGYLSTTFKVIVADDTSDPSQTLASLDSRIAARVSTTTPLVAGYHGYSGNSFPSTFNASNCKKGYDYGLKISLLNVKCDWTSLSNGGMDSTITSFANSIPVGHKVYLLINHEPENDGNPAGSAVWRAGQARAANLIASLNNSGFYYGVGLMSYTFKPSSGRTPSDWNPAGGMTSAALARAVFAPDGYTQARDAAGTNIDSMASEFDVPFNTARSWGFTRFGISEHSINNDINAPLTKIINWWNVDVIPYLRAQAGLEYYAFYNHTGPASGTNSYIDTPEEELMFGTLCLEQNR